MLSYQPKLMLEQHVNRNPQLELSQTALLTDLLLERDLDRAVNAQSQTNAARL